MEAWTVHNTVLNSSMGTDIVSTYRIRKGCFGPGRGYISTDIVEIYSSSTTGSDIHYRMLATMVLLTFLLKCFVMIQQEWIMQDVYTFAGTDHCQLPEYGSKSCICKSTSRTICFEPIHFSNNCDKFAQRKFLLSIDIELNPAPFDMDTVLSVIQASENKVLN